MILDHTYKLFVLIGAIGTVASVAMFVDPVVGLDMLRGVSPPEPAGAANDPHLRFLVRWMATAMLGGNALTIAIALTAFRRGERWAVLALGYWPLMFLSHLLMYRWGPMSLVQLGWIGLTVPVLVAHWMWREGPRPRTAEGRA